MQTVTAEQPENKAEVAWERASCSTGKIRLERGFGRGSSHHHAYGPSSLAMQSHLARFLSKAARPAKGSIAEAQQCGEPRRVWPPY